MKRFRELSSIAIPLMRSNVDTDAIIPSREIKGVSKTGLSDGLFANWRYKNVDNREIDTTFVFNNERYSSAEILISGVNFGCGSSREHAVWALKEWGIRSIFAISFGSIFFNNCVRNGILPIILNEEIIKKFILIAEDETSSNYFRINLPTKSVFSPDNIEYNFDLLDSYADMLIEGLDPIGLTLKDKHEIDLFQKDDIKKRPWVYI